MIYEIKDTFTETDLENLIYNREKYSKDWVCK